jgi:predicted PhzF superfamily epimerase YddE/YHI9
MKIDTSDMVRGVIVTILGGQDTSYDFISRYFAPWVGIPEDPVTGSAHTVLTPYWSEELGGKMELFARQCSPRGGELGLELKPDLGQVLVKGQGTIVLSGTLTL